MGDPDVVEISSTWCPPVFALNPARFAPVSEKGGWRPVFALAGYNGGYLLGGDTTFFANGFLVERGAAGWTSQEDCRGEGLFTMVGVDDEIQVDWSRGALAPSGWVTARGTEGSWETPGTGGPQVVLSGRTLLIEGQAYAVIDGAWSDPFPVTWESPMVKGLRADRFGLLNDDSTEVMQRVDRAWMSLGKLPAAKAIAMTDPSIDPALVTLGDSDGDGAKLYRLESEAWIAEQTFDRGTQPSLGSRSGEPIFALMEPDGAHIYSASADWAETDMIPTATKIPTATQVLARRDRIAILTDDPRYLTKVPADTPTEYPLTAMLVIYEPAE